MTINHLEQCLAQISAQTMLNMIIKNNKNLGPPPYLAF